MRAPARIHGNKEVFPAKGDLIDADVGYGEDGYSFYPTSPLSSSQLRT